MKLYSVIRMVKDNYAFVGIEDTFTTRGNAEDALNILNSTKNFGNHCFAVHEHVCLSVEKPEDVQYEYEITFPSEGLTNEILNKRGESGWELSLFSNSNMIWRRKI